MMSIEETPFVSVIIPAYNEEKYIRLCLESVLEQAYPLDKIEIIVVDNGSADSTPMIAEGLLTPRGSGKVLTKLDGTIASVRNFGWHHARGDVLAFLDGDSVVEACWLQQGVGILLQDASVSCVGFAVAPPDLTDSWVERVWFPISSSGKHRGTKEVQWLSSFNLLLRRDYFERVGGFDESLTTCEDADLGARLSTISRLIFSDSCHVKHLGTTKSVKEFMEKEYWRGQNSIRAFMKNNNKATELLSIIVPVAYLITFGFAIAASLLVPFINDAVYAMAIALLLLLLMPLLLAIRAGIRSVGQLFSTSILYVFYLLARGVAIVSFWR